MLAAIDIETHDPHLKDLGPGAIRSDGFIIGIGCYCPDKGIHKFYRPEDPEIRELLADESIDKVFHNGVYDLDWLTHGQQQFLVKGRCEDTMTRESLLDAYAESFHLDDCCKKRGVGGKNASGTIDDWWKEHGGKGKAVRNLKDIPFDIVGQYCKQDCKATYDLYYAQQPLLESEGVCNANDIEVRLYPLLMELRGNGMRVDLNECMRAGEAFITEYEQGIADLEKEYGFQPGTLSLDRATDLEKIWKAEGIPVQYLESGRPTFTKFILRDTKEAIGARIRRLKLMHKLAGFTDSWLDFAVGDHIYASFYPAKRDEGGTVTGRWSSQNPNLQQIPARCGGEGDRLRDLFLPEPGCLLGAFDYKQVEYRVFAHFASGEGAEEARLKYQQNPDLDYHQMVIDMMKWNDLGKEGRRLAKIMNFGTLYGIGEKTFMTDFGDAMLEAYPEYTHETLPELTQKVMAEYQKKVPFAKGTGKDIIKVAQSRNVYGDWIDTPLGRRREILVPGYVRTISGRKQRLRKPKYVKGKDGKWYEIKEDFVMINYLIQGTAADMFKKGLVDSWEQGIFDVLKIHATVHDEVVFSIPHTKEAKEACEQLAYNMAHAYPMKVPIGVDTEIGPDWGHCKDEHWQEFKKEFE